MADKEIVINVVSEYTDGASSGLSQTGKNADSLSDKLDELGKKNKNPKVNPNVDSQKTDSLSDKLDEIGKKNIKPRIGMDGREAEKTADGLGKKFDDLGGKKIKPEVSADDKASPIIDKTEKKGEGLGKKKWEPKLLAKDLASKAIELAESKGKAFAGKTFTAAVKVDDFATNQLKKIPGVLSRIKNSLFSLKTLAGGIATGFAAKKLIADPVALADEFETYQIGFETMLKSKKKATKFMDDAKTFASVTPFDTSAVVKNAQRMLAYGFNYKDIIPDLTRIGNASSALGAGEDGITRIAMALGQMKTSGKLNAGDMHQLTEVGINAWQYLADAEGKSIAQVREMSQKGEMSGKKAVDTILNGLKEFDGMMDKTSNSTVSGLMSNIQDVFDINIVSKWGKGLQKGATKGLGEFANYLDKSDAKLKEAGTSLEKLGEQASTGLFKELEKAGNKLSDLISMPKFQNATIGGKISIAWDELIATPFSDWWESKGKPGIIKKISGAGKDIAKAAGNWFKDSLKDLFPGGDKAGVEDYLAGYLALSGGLKLFKGGKNLIDFLTGGKTGGLGGDGNPLSGSLGTVNVSAAVVNVNGATTGNIPGNPTTPTTSGPKTGPKGGPKTNPTGDKEIWLPDSVKRKMPKGEPTAPKTSTPKGLAREPGGFLGLGGKNVTLKNGKTVEASGMKAFLGNVGVKLGSGAETATGAATVGGLSVLGGALGIAGIGSAAGNFLNAASTKDKAVKKKENYRGGTKLGMVGSGAAAGALIGSAVPVVGTLAGGLIGAGVGGFAALTKGNKAGDHIRKNMDKLKKEQDKNLKAWNVSSKQMKDINKKQEKYLGDNYLKDQKEALKNKNSSTAKAQKYYSYSEDDIKKIRDTYTPKHAKESFKKEDDLKKQIQVKYEKDQKDHKTKPNPPEMTSTMTHTAGGKGKTELKVGPNKEYDQLFKSIEEVAKRSRSNNTNTKDNKKQKNVLGKFGSNPFDITGNRSLTGRQKTQVVDNKTVKTAVKSKKEPGATVGPNKQYDQLTKSLMKAYSENGKNTKETESSTKKVKSYSATTASTQGKVSGLGSTSGGTSGKVAGLGSNSTAAGGNLSSMGAMGLAAGGNLQTAGSSALSLAGALASAAQTIASAAHTAQAQASAIANIKAGNIGNSGGGSSGSKKGGKTTTSKPTVKTALPAGGKFAHNAKGGYIGNHVVSELGEEGPEMVIPLSNHKGRAVSLWNQAGNILGVTRRAKGGIVGSGTVPAPTMKKSGRNATNTSRGTGQTVVNVGGITISVNAGNGSGNNGSVDIAKALKEQKNEIADTIMQAIADAVGSTVSNRTAEAM